MNPVLINTNNSAITGAKADLATTVPYVQQLYNAFKAIGVTVTLDDLRQMVFEMSSNVRYANPEIIIRTFVDDYFVNKAGTPSFNGVPINTDALKTLLAPASIDGIVPVLSNYFQCTVNSAPLRFDLLQITGDVVSKLADADQRITDEHTYYTKNDRGAMAATKLLAAANALNDYKSFIDLAAHHIVEGNIEGLELKDGNFRPSLTFIRSQERNYPNYVA